MSAQTASGRNDPRGEVPCDPGACDHAGARASTAPLTAIFKQIQIGEVTPLLAIGLPGVDHVKVAEDTDT